MTAALLSRTHPMLRTLTVVFGVVFGALFASSVSAQEIPGLRATLATPRSIVASGGNVEPATFATALNRFAS